MKAAVYYGRLNVKVETREDPIPRPGELVIKPMVVGVCPTDVRIYYNGSSSVKPPVILGHEVSGIVVDKASDVHGFEVGDRVNVAADAPCLNCRYCRKGYHNLCEDMLSLGFNVDGAYATSMRVPSRFVKVGVFRLNDDVGFEDGALIEPTAVSINALNLVMPRHDDNVVIIGDGPNALIHLMLLRNYYNVNKIVVLGLLDHRLKFASKLGADDVINVVSFKNIDDAVNAILSKIPVDVVDVTIANRDSITEALKLLGKGVRVTFFGGSHEDLELPITANKIHYNQLLITGSSGTSLENYKRAVELVNNGILRLRELITHEYGLDDILKAFETAKQGSGLKVIVKP